MTQPGRWTLTPFLTVVQQVELGVHGTQKTFYLTTREREDSPKVGLEISLTVEPLDRADKGDVKRLWTVDRLNASSHSIPSEHDARQWPHLRDIKLPSISEKEVRLIIGTNAPDAFWVLEERRGNREEPYAICTPLGWTLMGPMEKSDSQDCQLNVNFVRSAEVVREDNDCLMQQLERFWAVENFGVIPNCKVSMSLEDKRALAIMEQSVKLEDGHYQVALPWRHSTRHSCLTIDPLPNADCKRSRTGCSKMASSLKITRPPWNSILPRDTEKECHRTKSMHEISHYGTCLITRC